MFIYRAKTVCNNPFVVKGTTIEPLYEIPIITKGDYSGNIAIRTPSVKNTLIEGHVVRQMLSKSTGSGKGIVVSSSLNYPTYDAYYNAWCNYYWSTDNNTKVIRPVTLPKELVTNIAIEEWYNPIQDNFFAVRLDGYINIPKGTYTITGVVDDVMILRLSGNNSSSNGFYEGNRTYASSYEYTVIDNVVLTGSYPDSIAEDWYRFGIFFQEYNSTSYMRLYIKNKATGVKVAMSSLPVAYAPTQIFPGN